MKLLLCFLLLLGFTSFKIKDVRTRIYIAVLPPLTKGVLSVNNTKLIVKGRRYAEFEVTGPVVNFDLNIQLPIVSKKPPSFKMPGGGEIYVAVYYKQPSLLKGFYVMDTICSACYFELKKKCKKEAKTL